MGEFGSFQGMYGKKKVSKIYKQEKFRKFIFIGAVRRV